MGNLDITTKEQLLKEVDLLKAKIAELENSKSEGKRIEELLRESEEKYKAMYEQTPLSYQSLDINGNFLDVNPKWLSTLGYNKEEVIGKWFGDFLHPDYVEHFRINFPEFKKRGYINDAQFYIRKKNGEYAYISFEGCIGYTPAGDFKQTYCVFKDITKEFEIGKLLKESEEKYRNFFENNDAIILFVNPDNGNIIFANNAATKFYGYSKEQLEKLNINELSTLSPEDIKARLAQARLKKHNYFILKHKLADGKIRDVEVYQSKLQLNNQDIFSIIVHDITDRKLAVEEVANKEKQFRTIVESAGDAMFLADYETKKIIHANQQACKALGYTNEELLTLKVNELDPVYKADEEIEKLWSTMKVNEPITFETKHKRKDGSIFPIEVRTGLIIYDGKKTILGFARDITERKKAEEKIIEAKNKAQQYLNIADIMLISVDSSGIVQLINPKGCEILGYSEEEIIGQNWFDNFLPERLRENVKEVSKKVFLGEMESVKYFENEILTKSGNERIIAWHNSIYKDENEKIIGTLSSGEDITERKKAEEFLHKLNTAINNANEVIFMTDKEGIISYINPEFTKMYGYTAEEVIGKTTPRILKSDFFSKEQNQQLWNTLLNNQSIPSVSYVNKRKDGTYIDIEGSADPILDKHGNLMGFLAIHRDITERKQNEKATRASEERLKIIFESAPDAYFLMDRSGTFLDGNKAAEELLDYKKEELIGKNFINLKLLSIKELSKGVQNLARSTMGKKTGPDEFLLNRKDGSNVPVEIISYPVKINNKTVILGIARDITERKRNLKEMMEHRQQLAHIVEGTNAGTWDSHVQTGALILNDRWAEIMGYTLKELMPIDVNTWINKVHPEDLPKVNAILDKVFSKKLDYFNVEFRQPHKNGKWVWVNARGKVIEWSEDGKPLRMSGTHVDITERKRADQIQNIVYNISNAVSSTENLEQLIGFIQNELGTIIDTTNFYLALYDKQTDTLNLPYFTDEHDSFKTLPAEKTITRYVIQSQKSLLANLKTLKKLEKSGEIDRHGTDSAIWLGVPLKVEDKIIGAVVIQSYTDENAYNESDKKMLEFISDQISMAILRKKAEEDLISALNKAEESEKKFRELFEKSGDAVLILENRKFTDCNQAAFEMLQYNTKEEFLNTNPAQLSPESQPDGKNSKEKSDEMMEMAIKNGTHRFEWEHTKNNGSIFPVEVLLTAIFKNDVNEILHVTWRDITEHKKAEQDIITALNKAEESDRLKSAFLANMSHEIRTPMNGILGFADLLKQPDLSGDEQNSYIEVIEKAGKRMLNIINDLINISRIESGQADIVISEVNLNKQTEYLYTFFNPEAEKLGLKLSFKNTLPDAKAIIQSDNEKIYAILTNLIKNAIKYSPQGSIEFGYELKGKFIEFFVKDAGIGIEKSKQKAIFDRFVQADLSLSSKYEGAGLGLAISKGYVEMLGGKIWVESKMGEGSLFSFTIPYSLKADQASNEKEEDSKSIIETSSKKINILIAEDDETSTFYLTTMTKSISKETLHAKTGIEAIEICRANKDIDLVFMDIKMPEMDGYEASRKIREFNKDVIIIAQTAYALPGDKEKSLEAGCNDYIAKPISKNNLLEMIGKHFI